MNFVKKKETDKRIKTAYRSKKYFPYIINIPMMIYLAFVLFGSMIWGISLSFTDKTIGGEANFIGLGNYIKLLQDKEYLMSLWKTVQFASVSLIFKLGFGLLMAIVLNVDFKFRNVVRALLMIPWTLPNVVAVLNWKWLFASTGGIINHLLKMFGFINKDIVWFGSAALALATVIIANVWRGTPFFGISILAKLQTISHDYYEAADIDGANVWQKFFYITLPCIKDTVFLTTLMSCIWTINEFETVWLLTGGGPNGSTQVMNVYSYKTAMASMRIGRGIAVSVLAMPVFLIIINMITKKSLADENM